MKSKDKRFFDLAERESARSDHYRFRIGAVITKGRKILGSGFNSLTKSHPLQAIHSSKMGKPEAIYLHAEMAALIDAINKGFEVDGCSIYVFRRGLGGDLRTARPCRICMNALMEYKVRNIHYTTDFGHASEIIELFE